MSGNFHDEVSTPLLLLHAHAFFFAFKVLRSKDKHQKQLEKRKAKKRKLGSADDNEPIDPPSDESGDE